MVLDAGNLIIVGRVTALFGVKGWLKLHSYTQPITNLLQYKQQCFISVAGDWQPVSFDQGHRHGKGLVVHIKGCDDRDEGRRYIQSDLAIEAGSMPQLEQDEYYWHQLEGLQVWIQGSDGARQLLGRVDHLLETGSNDVLVIKSCQGSVDQRERMLPYRPNEVIKSIDLETGSMIVDWDPMF